MVMCGMCYRELGALAGVGKASTISGVMVRLGYNGDDIAEFASDAGAR